MKTPADYTGDLLETMATLDGYADASGFGGFTPDDYAEVRNRINAHDELVAALRDLYALHEPEGRFQPSHFKPVLDRVATALAKCAP